MVGKKTVSRLIYGVVFTCLAAFAFLAVSEPRQVEVDTHADIDPEQFLFEELAGEWWGRVDHSEVLMRLHDQRGYFVQVTAGELAVARVEAMAAGISGRVLLRFMPPRGAGFTAACLVEFGNEFRTITVEKIEPAPPWPECPFLMNRVPEDVHGGQLDRLRKVADEVAQQDQEDAR